MRDLPQPQVPQDLEGLRQEEEEKEGHKPSQEELQPQGT